MSLDFTQNYFELFGLPVQFDVDLPLLAERYRDLQKVLHPDRHADKGAHEQRLAVQASSHLNRAMDTLKHPLARARYILSLHGINMDGDTDTRMDQGFLFQQMEWRESLQALPAGDASEDAIRDVLDQLADEVQQERRHRLSALADLLARQDWQAARDKIRELQFIDKMLSEIDDKEAALDA
ncbi:MAG: Fe-S protein assembly co-chaperone HscB [Gammaproteobacteria bacterium]|nr:MAG: Fe-S protein assembly co-chaperone HscB [Gammaproteobacteria bacterium]